MALDTSHARQPTTGQLRQIGHGARLNLVGAGTAAVANFALVVLLARALSRATAGLFFTATSIFLLASILAQLGTRTGLVYWVARLRAQDRASLIPRCLSIALRPVAVAGIAAGLSLAVVGAIIHTVGSGSTASVLATQLYVLAPFVPLAALSDSCLAGTRGFGAMKPTVLIENIGRTLVQLALCTVCVLLTHNLTLVALTWALPYAGSAALGSLRLRRMTAHTVAGAPPVAAPGRFAWRFWRFTLPRAFASIAQLLLQRLDIVLVAALRGPTDAAIYTAATRLLVAGQLGGQAISTAVQPKLAESLSVGHVVSARQSYQTATCWLILLTWPFYLLCIVYAHEFLGIFGHGYATASDVAVLLAASMLVATACGMVDLVLTMGGRTMWNLANTIGALIVNIGVDIALIPRYGVFGAAIGWAAAILYNNLVPLGQIWHLMRLQPIGRPSALAIALTSVLFGAVPGVLVLTGQHGAVAMLATIAAALVAYGILLLVNWDRLHLRELVPARWSNLAFLPASRA